MGEAYPGSTGGEIFNCYETIEGVVTRNEATGDYSTAVGCSNKANVANSWVCGDGNSVTLSQGTGTGNWVLGRNNTITSYDGANEVIIGKSNTSKGRGNIILGYDNTLTNNSSNNNNVFGHENSVAGSKGKNYLIGYKNETSSNAELSYLFGEQLKSIAKGQVIIGRYNDTSISGNGIHLGTGTGTSYRRTGMKLNYDEIAFYEPLIFNGSSKVQWTTAPPDPDNLTTDDQTLVTKSYRRNLPAQLTDDLVNNQSTSITNGATLNLETDFSITFPAWTELIKIGITNSGGYMDYITMAADVNKSYVSVTGAGTIDEYSYNAATKDFTFVSGGASASILSIRAEGKTTI